MYGLVSYNYEFLGDIESRASLGDKSARMERSLDGGWFSYGIGAQANISKIWSAYGELERTSGVHERFWRIRGKKSHEPHSVHRRRPSSRSRRIRRLPDLLRSRRVRSASLCCH